MLHRIGPQSLYCIQGRPRKYQISYIFNIGLVSNNEWLHYSGLFDRTINCNIYAWQLFAHITISKKRTNYINLFCLSYVVHVWIVSLRLYFIVSKTGFHLNYIQLFVPHTEQSEWPLERPFVDAVWGNNRHLMWKLYETQ